MSDDAGSVSVSPGAGAQEISLLTARAIEEAAATIASAVSAHGDMIVIAAGGTLPSGDRSIEYDTRLALVRSILVSVSNADAARPDDVAAHGNVAGAGGRALLGPSPVAAIDGLGRVGQTISSTVGLFKSDYQIGGIDVTPNPGSEDALLAGAVAAALLVRRGTAKRPVVAFASTFGVDRRRDALVAVDAELSALARSAAALEADVEACGTAIAEREAAVAAAIAASDAATAASARAEVSRLRARCERLTIAASSVSAFFVWLASSDGPNGPAILARVVTERSVELASAAHARLVTLHVRTANAGGDLVTRKSLFAGLFSIPLSVSGGATVSYALLDRAGDLIAADVITVYGGLVRLDRLRDKLTGTPDRTH